MLMKRHVLASLAVIRFQSSARINIVVCGGCWDLIIWPKNYILACLLTPWCRVLLEKLTGLQLVKKFPAFYGTRRFITALTSVRLLSLSWASPIQSIYPHPPKITYEIQTACEQVRRWAWVGVWYPGRGSSALGSVENYSNTKYHKNP